MSNLNLNHVVLAGRLTATPEPKLTQSGIAVVSFTLAVNRDARIVDNQRVAETDFISCVAWRNTAEFISKYFKKGSALCITGSIQTRNWTDDSGNKHYNTEVLVGNAKFVDSANSSNVSNIAEPYGEAVNLVENFDDEELPL